MESDNKSNHLNDNNLIIVRRDTGYFLFLWYCVLLTKEAATHMRDTLEMIYTSLAEQRGQLLKAQPALKRAAELTVRCEEKLNALLDGKAKEQFQKFLDAEDDRFDAAVMEHFILGFRLGMRLAVEGLDWREGE